MSYTNYIADLFSQAGFINMKAFISLYRRDKKGRVILQQKVSLSRSFASVLERAAKKGISNQPITSIM